MRERRFDARSEEHADEDAVKLAGVEVMHLGQLVGRGDQANIGLGDTRGASPFPRFDDDVPILGSDEVHRGPPGEDLVASKSIDAGIGTKIPSAPMAATSAVGCDSSSESSWA